MDNETMVLQTCLNGGIQSISPVLLSQFDINDTERAFVAGIEGLSWSDFQIGYDGYCYQSDFIVDVEKCISVNKDDMMCWAAVAANMLYYAKWWYVETEDAVFSVFADSFQNGETRGGSIFYGIDWFLTGNYTPSRIKSYDQPLEGTGGFYKDALSDAALNDHLYTQSFTVDNLTDIKEKFESGYAAGVSIDWTAENGVRIGGHAVSLWGFTYDTSLSVSDPNYYTGIIISDSDDDHWNCNNSDDAPDTLKIISIFYDGERKKYILDPAYSEFFTGVLKSITWLEPNSTFTPDILPDDIAVKIFRGGKLVSQTSSVTGHCLGSFENDLMHVSSGGTVSDISVDSGGSLCVLNGGSAAKVVENGGFVKISQGAEIEFCSNSFFNLVLSSAAATVHSKTTAEATELNDGGKLYVFEDGTANTTVVKSGGELYVSKGGTANSATVSSGGTIYISGGIANSATVSSGGRFYIYSGGTANSANVSTGGRITVFNSGTADSATVSSGGWLYISSGGTANSATVSSGGWLYISSGGTANSATVSSGGRFYIYSGGIANSANVSTGGYLRISSDGIANSATVSSGGTIYISGGIANSATVSSGGRFYIYSGGIADSVIVNTGGYINVSSEGTVSSAIISSGGYLCFSSGASGVEIVENGGFVDVKDGADIIFAVNTLNDFNLGDASATLHSGTIFNNAVINSGGDLHICNGGIADTVTVSKGGYIYISSGGTANSANVSTGGRITVFNSGTADSATVSSGGWLYISSGGTANSATVSSGGYLWIFSGGIANSANVSTGGYLWISSDGIANSATVSSGGYLRISSGGTANSANVSTGGRITVFNGGTADSATVSSGGWLYISSGGTANSAIIASCAYANILSGGIANDTLVNGGKLQISSGGVHYGNLQIGSGGTVFVYDGGIIDFSIKDRSLNDGYLINDLSLISGTPDYRITVSASQNAGTYKLALGAAGFDGSITVGDGITEYGMFSLENTQLEYEGRIYTLGRNEDSLFFTVADIVPELNGNADGVSWKNICGNYFTLEYSCDDFSNSLKIETADNAMDICGMPSGIYKWRITGNNGTFESDDVIAVSDTTAAKFLVSENNGVMDLFFVRTAGRWESGYAAQHNGAISTGELCCLDGKNKVSDIFQGSDDANILVMTDDANGDALFLDDIFTAFPDDIESLIPRISQIDEIRCGKGDDIVDMTSSQFGFSGRSIRICGGNGDDIIWAGAEENIIFGDAGNDRLVGGSGHDIIIGGSGNDSMHGGGGEDIFTFGSNWGNDIVEQFADGSVTLWFEYGSEENWNAEELIYSDGKNSVKVIGAADIKLKFGSNADLPIGIFADEVTGNIFESRIN